MTEFFKRFFGFKPSKKQKSDFSAFFYDASEQEQRELLLRVIKQANADQRRTIEKYDEQVSHAR